MDIANLIDEEQAQVSQVSAPLVAPIAAPIAEPIAAPIA